MKNFFENRFTLFNIAFDLIIFACTLFLGWDPAKLLAFYWIDLCVQLIFYISYMRLLGYLRLAFKLLVTFFVGVGLMTIYLIWIVKIAPFTGIQTYDEDVIISHLFRPYYEVTFFLVLSGLSSYHFYRKIRSSKSIRSEVEFFLHLNCGLALLSIPLMLFFTTVLFALTLNVSLTLIFSIALVRNRLDAWRNKNLRKFIAVEKVR
jgi:hypothetical protein